MREQIPNNNTAIDEHIRDVMAGLQYSVPASLEDRVHEALIGEERKRQQRGYAGNRWAWFSLPTYATALVVFITLLLMSPFSEYRYSSRSAAATTRPAMTSTNATNEGSAEISEIKTELVLTDSNIKIIWVQKKDFNINQTTN